MQRVKFLITPVSPICHYSHPLRSKHAAPKHSVLIHPCCISYPSRRDNVSLQINYSSANFNVYILGRRREDKIFWSEWYEAFSEFNLLSLSSWHIFICSQKREQWNIKITQSEPYTKSHERKSCVETRTLENVTRQLVWSKRSRKTLCTYKHYSHCVLRQREPLASGQTTSTHYRRSVSFIRAQ